MGKHIFAFSLDPEITKKAKEICKETSRSLSAIVEKFLITFIENKLEKDKKET